MSLVIHADLESKIRARAESEGLTIEEYLERLVRSDEQAVTELEKLAIEGLNSGQAAAVGPSYWQDKHRRLDERLKKN